MGARTTFQFITEGEQQIVLYSHWGGETKTQDLARAIAQAKPRWGDDTYSLRIMVSRLIGTNWENETGYGLWTTTGFEEEYLPIVILIQEQKVAYDGEIFTFEQFIEKYK